MKNKLKSSLGGVLAFLFLVFLPFVASAQTGETIRNFNVAIKINSDASLDVQESIIYNFDSNSRHGIFRDLPINYAARGGNFALRISNISVVDADGAPYKFTTSYPGKNIEIKIGDANQYVTGQKTYIIKYKISRAINYFSDHDELYWNVTGNDWTVPIEKSSAQITLPQTINIADLKKDCFAGNYGSTISCSDITTHQTPDNLVTAVEFGQIYPLPAGQGFTIVVGWPKNLVTKPSAIQNILDTVKDNWVIFLPILTLIIMLYLWHTRGRDPKGRGTIIAQYEAPDNLTPAEIGSLIDEKLDPKDISSEIIYLATQGFIKITRIENKGLIFKHEDYLLERQKEIQALGPIDKRLMDGLFPGGVKTKNLSDLKNQFYKEMPDIKNKVFDALVSNGYFPEKPSKVQGKYTVIGFALLIGATLLAKVLGSVIGGLAIGSLIASGFIVVMFGMAMPRKTEKGVIAKENILGLKEYLQVAEKDRIKFFNAPAKNPEHFEKLLPYAMVLGVEQEWAKQFAGIYNQPPSWYHDPSGGAFNALILVHSLNNFNHSANAALVSTPRSAAGGGSGFSGGGFSGGGFGGGGGGSW